MVIVTQNKFFISVSSRLSGLAESGFHIRPIHVLMDRETPSYRTFGYFINEVLSDSIEDIFADINHAIFEEEHVDLQHIYIDGSKFEANANKYTWVWKKATERSRYRLYDKITTLISSINESLIWSGVKISTNTEYVPDYLREVLEKCAMLWQIDENTFVYVEM